MTIEEAMDQYWAFKHNKPIPSWAAVRNRLAEAFIEQHTCATCGAMLLPNDEPAHCEDCPSVTV